MPDDNDAVASSLENQTPSGHCLECGRPINAETPHGVCSDCSLRNLLNTSFHQTVDFGSQPLIDHPEKDVTVDEGGHAKLVDPLSPGECIGPFEVVRRLGRGGMGTVYEAQDTENQRRVALKVLIRPVENEAARQRFLREGRLAASINHPNSVFVFGTHQIDRLSLISMELVGGGTLEQRVRAHGPMPPREAVDAALQIIDGLDAAYARGILHRDIKPANCFEASDGFIKIGDFGLSISTDPDFDSRVTTEGTILGTPAFSSPEQLRGDSLDVRSDIYALGVTLYFLLTGRTPYQAGSLVKLLSQVFESSPPSPRSLRPEVSPELSHLVMRCLAKEPGDRFRTYAELREALIPLSSQIPEPASLGWRTIAGLVDWAVLASFGLVYTAVTSLASEPMLGSSYIASRVSAVSFTTLYIFYYGLCDSMFGQTVGKKLLGLRTIQCDGGRPTFRQALLRATVFILFPSLVVLPYNFFFRVGADAVGQEISWNTFGLMVVGLTYWGLWAVMFSTARSRNGLAGLHELISETRVVSQAFCEAPTHAVTKLTQAGSTSNIGEIGPYKILESLATADGTTMHIAYDPLLLRRVWLRCEDAMPHDATDQYRTRLSRPTRLRWLNRVSDHGKTWDIYEAPTGIPLVDRLQAGEPSLQRVNVWLGDLTRELEAAIGDGTLPARLGIEQLWLTESGRLKVLDFAAPGISELECAQKPDANLTPQQRSLQLLKSLAPRLRAAITPGTSSLPPPLYFTRMLSDWELSADLAHILKTTQSVSARPLVSPKRRRLMMAAACYVLPVMQVALLIAHQLLSGIFFANNQDIRQLRSLVNILQAGEPFKNAGMFEELIAKNPELESTLGAQLNSYYQYRAAATLIAGEHRGILDDPRMQSLPAMMHLYPAMRQKIAAVQAEIQPSEAELTAATTLLADELNEQNNQMTMGVFSGASTALMFSFITWVGYVAFPAMFAGLLFRGGIIIYGFQSVLVRMNGKPAGRLRIFLRAALAALPGIVALFCLMGSGNGAFGLTHSPLNPVLVSVCVGAAIAGAVVSNLFGNRSLADRIIGTAVVAK